MRFDVLIESGQRDPNYFRDPAAPEASLTAGRSSLGTSPPASPGMSALRMATAVFGLSST
jgi:hypothetical protein